MTDRPAAEWDGVPAETLAGVWGVPRVEAWDSIGSTNDRAAELAREGAPPWTVVVADAQTEGRGRRGGSWSSPRGAGLLMSVVLDASAAGAQLPLVVGVACVEALRASAHTLPVLIKWPNDLWVRGRKLGGILCEASGPAVVAGIGINVSTPVDGFPDTVRAVATSLEICGVTSVSRNVLAGRLLSALVNRLQAADPYVAVQDELASLDALRDRSVETTQEGPGTARGFDADGALLLERRDHSRVRVISGSVRPTDGPA